jgi:hypothetical protein
MPHGARQWPGFKARASASTPNVPFQLQVFKEFEQNCIVGETLEMTARLAVQGFRHAGFIKVGEEFYPCSVTNMSSTGATLHLPPWHPMDLPPSFALQLTREGKIVRQCSLTCQEGEEANVLFECTGVSRPRPEEPNGA